MVCTGNVTYCSASYCSHDDDILDNAHSDTTYGGALFPDGFLNLSTTVDTNRPNRRLSITQNELYPAELYFGYMLAGTNYDDDEERAQDAIENADITIDWDDFDLL